MTKEDWNKAGLDEQDDPDVAEKKKPAEPSSIEEIGKQLWSRLLPRTHWTLTSAIEWFRILDVRFRVYFRYCTCDVPLLSFLAASEIEYNESII